ncbi:MAG: alkane 1-monooxygenase [Roseovarius sp.]
MLLFATVTLLPFGLAALGAVQGGAPLWLALGYMTLLVVAMDRLVAGQAPNAAPDAEFPAARPLLLGLGAAHFGLLGLVLWGVAGASGLGLGERVALGFTAALIFGQISHPTAHELIHQPGRGARLLGRLIYTSLLVGHHASAHLLVHHVHVGSRDDPNSAPKGESFYRYALRVTRESFLAGLRAETARHRRAGKPLRTHPYLLYIAGGAALVAAAGLAAGLSGLLAYLAIAGYAQVQILMSDYVQHYGLRRRTLPDGRREPVGPQHSWNAPQVVSSALMLNAPRHSDHHVTPARPYPALQLDRAGMPMLPRSLPVMAALACVPPLWFRVMNPRVARWAQDGAAAEAPARNMSQEARGGAKSGSLATPVLPNSAHEIDASAPLSGSRPDRPATGGARRQ